MNTNILLKRLERIEDLPTLPVIASKVNSMIQDYDVSINKLSEIIEMDQAIMTKILKLVNSAFFGFRAKVANISHAIVLLGCNTIRNSVVSVSIIETLSKEKALEGFDVTGFWTHSISTAVICRHLAEKTRIHSPEDAFTAGLLHDIGKILLYQYFYDLFEKVWISAKKNSLSFYEAEKKEIPSSHSVLGAFLANRWQLPAGLVDAVKYHHAVNTKAFDLNLLMLVHVADIISNTYGVGRNAEFDVSAIYPDAAEIMQSILNTLPDWFPVVSEEIESARRFFLEEEV